MRVGLGGSGIGYHGDLAYKGVGEEAAGNNNEVWIRETNI